MPITLTSRFKPLTYDEITKPLIEQTQAQEALENAYVEASDQAAQIMAQANQQTDPISYARLKNYSESLQQQADNLMRQGLNRNSRQSLLNMRRKYTQDIVPVQAAVTRRNELMEERRKMMLTHPDMVQERAVIGLDDLLQNPQMDFGATLYGSEYRNRAAQLVQAINRGRQSIKLGQNLDKYTQTILSQTGLTADEIMNGGDATIKKALDNLYMSSGVDSWQNPAAKAAIRSSIDEGALLGAGQVSISTQVDRNALRRDALADEARQRKNSLIDLRRRLQIQKDFAEGNETLGGVTAHEVGYHVGADGSKVKIYQDNDGNYYTKDASANGKTKRFVPTDLTPTTVASGGRSSSGSGYVPTTDFIQIVGGTLFVTGTEANMVGHEGDGTATKFYDMDAKHRAQVFSALGLENPQDYIDEYGDEDFKNLCKELDKYYMVIERNAKEKHKDSSYDWVDVRPRGNTRVVSQIGDDVEHIDYSAAYEQILQQILSNSGQQ